MTDTKATTKNTTYTKFTNTFLEMHFKNIGFVCFVYFVAFVVTACKAPADDVRPIVSVTRQVGAWSGRGTRTVGDVNSDTGRLRISWQTTNESPAGAGTFKLTLRSGVSGRTIGIVTDTKGVASGSADFDEGPRTYDFLVESANVDWSFKVDETTGVFAPGAGRSAPDKQDF